MSQQATVWALYDAPTDLDGSEFRILMLLADRADRDGTKAFPSASRLADEAGVSVRTVRYKLKSLEERGLIRRGDQTLMAKRPANRRPTVYDLCMDRGAEVAPQEHEPASSIRGAEVAPQEASGVQTGVQSETVRGANRGATCLHNNPSKEVTNNNPVRVARANENSTSTIQNFQPTNQHRALAVALNLDLDAEFEKFRDSCLATNRTSADWDASFRNWLRRGHELGITRQSSHIPAIPEPRKVEPHRHTVACEHVTSLIEPYANRFSSKNVNGFGSSPLLQAKQALADKLNEGMTSSQALANLHLPTDDIEDIA